METKIISFFNKIFICLKEKKIKAIEDFSNPILLYDIGLEIDHQLFSEMDSTVTGEDNLGIRISELTEVSEVYFSILKPPEFNPTEKYKTDIESIDVISIANKENKNIHNLAILVLITIFFCEKYDYYSSEINKLPKDEQKFIYDLVSTYVELPKRDKKEKKDNQISNNTNNDNINNNDIISYQRKIEQLEKELKEEKEKGKRSLIIQEEYNNIKQKLLNIESKYTSLLKELKGTKAKNQDLERIIEEKNNKIGILQNKLDEKSKIIKERDVQLNKEIETNMDLDFKLKELKELNDIKSKNDNDYENKYKEELKENEELKNENIKLNDLINIMEVKLNEKSKDDIESDMNNIRVIDELEKKIKLCEKEKNDIKNQFDKEFELMASAIYNLGFQFWSLKCEDSQKLKQNENWLVKERIKQYNGDY